jgi:hypothetical protein
MGDAGFDYASYLATLEEFRVPARLLPDAGVPLREWTWPPLRSYNGFSGEQRVRVWQLQGWAQDVGVLPKPKWCSVCGSGSHVGFHCESYADPWSAIPLCQSCHLAVHRRFREPETWVRFQVRHRRAGPTQWFELLPVTEINLAGWLLGSLPQVGCTDRMADPDDGFHGGLREG